jgi:flagellar basal-body rod protein FlgB
LAIRPGAATVKLADADSRAPVQPRNFPRSAPGPALAVVGDVPVDLSAVDTLQAAMTYHRERHTVLAGNVANLDTPGYRPMDLQRRTAEDPVPMAVTHDGQIASQSDSDYVTSYDDGGALQGPDGNAVTLEREMSKIDANRARYATAAELVSRRLAMLRYAAGDGT